MRIHPINKVMIFIFLLFSMVLKCHSVWAHGVDIFVWSEGDTAFVKTKFKGGNEVKAGSIIVKDMQGHELLSGITNEKGEFSFNIPKREDLKIVVMDGAGHRAEGTLKASEMGEWPETTNETEGAETTGQRTKTVTVSYPSQKEKDHFQMSHYVEHDHEMAIEALLDKKLKPIMKMLADERQKGPKARDVLAGIGYIFGVVGIVTYVKSRRRKE